MWRSMTLMFFALTVVASTSVHAAKKMAGVEFGVNAGYATFTPLGKSAPSYDGSYTTSVYVGYNFVHFFGLELGYGISGKFKPDDEVANAEIDTQTIRIGPTMWGDVTDFLAIYNKIQYANVTLKKTVGDSDSLDTNGAYYELGLLWHLTDNIGITTSASYLWTTGDSNNFAQIQGLGGLHFRF